MIIDLEIVMRTLRQFELAATINMVYLAGLLHTCKYIE